MKKTKIILGLSLLLLLAGCYPSKDVYYNDLDLVGTNYDTKFNFSDVHTYALPDSIILISDGAYDSLNPVFVKQTTANQIINQIRSNMNSYGWTEVNKNVADVIILPAAFQTTNVSYYYSWGYWGWYYPGYYPGYGWGYPGYGYGYPTSTTYQTGTLVMSMTYPNGTEVSNVPVVWTGVINGLLSGSSTSSVQSLITTDINQAFTQSPYLRK
jgi:hypothetical protein